MEYSKIIQYLALQNGIDSVDFESDVLLRDDSDGNGVYIKSWNLAFDQPSMEDLSIAEDAAMAYFKAIDVRKKRDSLLDETDWVVLRAIETDSSLSTDWKLYRQALRDFTDDPKFPNVDFPVKPE